MVVGFQGSLFGVPEGRFAQIALDTPVRREFAYCVPSRCEPLAPGCRVRVPFGRRESVGVVVAVDDHPPANVPPDRIKSLLAVLDVEPLLTPALLRLAHRIADDTYCSWGQALSAMLPAALRRDRPRRTIPVVELLKEVSTEEIEELEKKHPKQAKAVAYLQQAGGPMEVREFRNRTGLSKSPLDTLAKKGWVKFGRKQEVLDPFADIEVVRDSSPKLTSAQQACVDEVIGALGREVYDAFLLFGITGSGKTEVYLHAMEHCLEQGRGAIVLVPEIALTPQTVSRFRARCGQVAVLHSGLTDAERHDQWLAIREGRVRVVVGARSALFAPMPRLGLIVLDEEHESSFKQESTPRYHARDVALERCRLEGAVCILGSATPALESWASAMNPGGLRLLELRERVAGGVLPSIQVVDMRVQKPEKGKWLVLSQPLVKALGDALQRKERAILFLNQRGFAPAWHCKSCGGSVHCKTCDVALTYHRWRKKAICHYCLHEEPPPQVCTGCGRPVEMVGVGTERVEDSVQRMFPHARLARMDRDTMLRRESYEEVLADFGSGNKDILLGTQMVAKGLDFPEVTLVGVLNADTALHHPDFRASERCFNLIAQVAGRAGRSARGGKVVVQTWLPDHPAILAASKHDYVRFAQKELEERKLFGFPPYGKALRLTFEAEHRQRVEQTAEEAAAALRANMVGRTKILGPSAPPMEKLRGRIRRQILIKTDRDGLHALREVLYALSEKQGVTVDPL
ncbi:MAG: primosomal protein N' [Planctomycetota bacterium]|nr:primosomal protein N' [Planctomycetota bacterium]MDA1113342.1 primosomal protein N' [Planctomycetota bacterium]